MQWVCSTDRGLGLDEWEGDELQTVCWEGVVKDALLRRAAMALGIPWRLVRLRRRAACFEFSRCWNGVCAFVLDGWVKWWWGAIGEGFFEGEEGREATPCHGGRARGPRESGALSRCHARHARQLPDGASSHVS